jgi:uncharacterized protein YdhG (YjbR/CyaY superfamily)
MDAIDQYIEKFPQEVQLILIKIRETIKAKAPQAVESFSYGMPAYKTNGKPLVYFAGYKNHIGFYATPTGHKAFETQLSIYKQGKGSVQFPLNKPIPYDLIEQIVAYKVSVNQTKK